MRNCEYAFDKCGGQEMGAAMTALTSACNTRSESSFLSLASQLERIHVMLTIQITMRSNGGCAEANLKQLGRTRSGSGALRFTVESLKRLLTRIFLTIFLNFRDSLSSRSRLFQFSKSRKRKKRKGRGIDTFFARLFTRKLMSKCLHKNRRNYCRCTRFLC